MSNISEIQKKVAAARLRIEAYNEIKQMIGVVIEDLIYDVSSLAQNKRDIPPESPLGQVITEINEWLEKKQEKRQYNFNLKATATITYENFKDKIK